MKKGNASWFSRMLGIQSTSEAANTNILGFKRRSALSKEKIEAHERLKSILNDSTLNAAEKDRIKVFKKCCLLFDCEKTKKT